MTCFSISGTVPGLLQVHSIDPDAALVSESTATKLTRPSARLALASRFRIGAVSAGGIQRLKGNSADMLADQQRPCIEKTGSLSVARLDMFKEPTFYTDPSQYAYKNRHFYTRTDPLLKLASLVLDADFRGHENFPLVLMI